MSQSAISTPSALAAKISGRMEGACPVDAITGVASLAEAGPTDVSFLASDKYRHLLKTTRAPLVLVAIDFPEPPPEGKAWIRCQEPSKAFSALVSLFIPPPPARHAGIHPTAVVDRTARVAASAHIGPCVVVAAEAVIGERAVVMAGTFIGEQAVIGSDCVFYPHVTVRERCLVGPRTILHPGVVIGADGFGYDSDQTGHHKIPQVGIVEIGADVEIGANSCVDRARFGVTRIGDGTKIDNLVQIGHNCRIGRHCILCAQVGLAGSTILGDYVYMAGKSGSAGHLSIGDRAMVGAQGGVTHDLPADGLYWGTPAIDARVYKRILALQRKLPQIYGHYRQQAKKEEL